ncbi:sigma-70 family RNA polymerase sigma factor [Lysinibacillus sp. 54212]|uniref:sigma-70 family RNA polymerase sigma factor n=1 Tax=Lysinibacillus sp. 54212 TaxID=3119829 RepID=UPI002FCB7D73
MSHKISKLEWAMDEYGELLIRLAYTYVKDIHVAEDIIQDVFLKVYEKDDGFRFESSYKTYLYQITINRCKDYLKSWSFRSLFFTDNRLSEAETNESTENTMIRFEEDFELGEKVLALPIKYREVLILHYYQDYSISEVSSILGISQNTVNTRLRRAKERIKSNMSRNEEGDQIG